MCLGMPDPPLVYCTYVCALLRCVHVLHNTICTHTAHLQRSLLYYIQQTKQTNCGLATKQVYVYHPIHYCYANMYINNIM